MIIRPSVYEDIKREDFRELVIRGLKPEEIGMIPCWEKLENMAETAIRFGFWECAEHDGKIVGHILAFVGDNPMFYGRMASVLAWYSEYPGAGMALFRRFSEWAAAQHVASVSIHTNPDSRLDEFLTGNGWIMCPNYLKVVSSMDS